VVRQLSPSDFQDLVAAGLPRHVQAAVAREVGTREGAERLRRVAEGTEAASVWDRINALHVLAAGKGAGAYRALEASLRSGHPVLAATATRLLRELNDERAAGLLASALADGVFSRSRLASALERMTVNRADILPLLVRHKDAAVRAWGARLAGTLNARNAAPEVRALVSDNDAVVRRAAVEALGRIGDPSDRALLRGCFEDPSPMVRAHAARAAVSFGDPFTANALAGLLADREWVVRTAARDALQQLDGTGRPVLLRALWHRDRFAANTAAEALHALGTAARLARRLLANPDDTDATAAFLRFWDVAGPHLQNGLLAQLDPHEVAGLQRHVQSESEGGRGEGEGGRAGSGFRMQASGTS
jgi:HEAT repeat protein